MKTITHKSSLDESVNFYTPIEGKPGAAFEARYVRRNQDKVSVYLSSFGGCNLACRMCHLTANGLTDMTPATIEDYKDQFDQVFQHYRSQVPVVGQAVKFEINFMARGDALLNDALLNDHHKLFAYIEGKARLQPMKTEVTFNISTIFPKDIRKTEVLEMLLNPKVELFYSLYSLDSEFRKRWLPKAMHPDDVKDEFLLELRDDCKDFTIHYCLIKGENDRGQTRDIAHWLDDDWIDARLNIVRFNPPNDKYEEPDESHIQAIFDNARDYFTTNSRIVDRVGTDVAAACGMFLKD